MQFKKSVIWALSLALILAPALPAASLMGTEGLADKYPPFVIGPGDLLNITVYGEKDLPVAFLVESKGSIVFPLVGEINLLGLTQSQAGERLAKSLSKFQKDPQVTVLVTESAQYNISVLGNVARPGKYRIRGVPDLLSALAEAGGPLQNSSLNSTVLVRGEDSRKVEFLGSNGKPVASGHGVQVSLGDYLSSGKTPPQILLYPGDVLYVPRSPWPTIGEWGIIMGIISSGILIANSLQNRR